MGVSSTENAKQRGEKMDIEKKILLDLLKEYMGENDLSQKEIAARLGVSTATVTHWLSGRNEIAKRHEYKILDLCERQLARMTQDVVANMPILENYKNKLLAAIAAANLPPIYRDKVISIILETK